MTSKFCCPENVNFRFSGFILEPKGNQDLIHREDHPRYNRYQILITTLQITRVLIQYSEGGVGLGISLVCFSFISPALRRYCLPYVPATTRQLNNVIGALKQEGRKGQLIDIGSGDGRIVIEAARAGVCSSAHGVELNRWLVYYSRWMAYRSGVGATTKFFQKDLWKADLSPYSQVVIFGVDQMVR